MTFFETNRILVYFLYAFIFFLMGFGILLKNLVHSRFHLAKSIKYLAAFGILHGISDWGNFFIPIQSAYLSDDFIFVLMSLQVILNAFSFFFLFYFGAHLIHLDSKWGWKWLILPPFFLCAWVICFMVLQPILVTDNNRDWWFAISDIWARFLLAFPGGVISFIALSHQVKQFRNLGVGSMIPTLRFSAASFGVYALTSGLIVPYAPVLPRILIHSDLFFSTVGFPVEVIRGLSGLLMAFFIIRILRVFDIEYHNYFNRLEKETAITEERNRIARDLHDGMIQSIFATGLHLEGIRHLLSNLEQGENLMKADYEITGVNNRLNDLIKEIRQYIKELKSPRDREPKLLEEIDRLIREIRPNLKINVHADFLTREPLLSETIQIYYIVKEALSNTLRHAEATQIQIKIKQNDSQYIITIEDNGKGFKFSPFIAENDIYSGEFKQGLRNMQFRAQSIGGKLDIHSEVGKGTKIILQSRAPEEDQPSK